MLLKKQNLDKVFINFGFFDPEKIIQYPWFYFKKIRI